MEQIFVNASRKYQAVIGRGILAQAGNLAMKIFPPCRAVIVTDEKTAPRALGALSDSLTASGYRVESMVLRADLSAKGMESATKLLTSLADAEISRKDAIFALGGGTVGDVAGFVASVYQRGIALVQVPTTLRAAVDSSIGGKNGVCLSGGRDVVGTFWQPSLVLCDTDTLKTLPPVAISDGMAEIVKYAAISDRSFFQQLHDGLSGSDGELMLERMIARCVKVKADYVMRDETGKGMQNVLDFGRTVGRAVALCSGYQLPYGTCTAIGMCVVTRAAEREGMCMPVSRELADTLGRYGLASVCPYGAEELSQAFMRGLAKEEETVSLVLLRQLGQVQIVDFPVRKALSFIAAGLAV